MKYWNSYTKYINRNCGCQNPARDLEYWRDNLFAGALIYLLPFCFIALVPGLYWIFIIGDNTLAVIDFIAIAALAIIAFVPRINPAARKIIFVSVIYLFSCAMLIFIGLSGPGLLYLLASSIFTILIFPAEYSFLPAFLNTFICALFASAVYFKFAPASRINDHVPGAWVAISSNLVFLSFLLSALIPRLFNGLQQTLEKEKVVSEQLNIQQRRLEKALQMLQQKNGELEQFAYVASHDLKEPLRMVNNFMGLLKSKYGDLLDEKARTYISLALDGGKRMQKMIADLLELSRTARNDSEKEVVSLNEVLNDVTQNIFKLIEETQARIIVKTELPLMHVYRGDILRLLQNLLINAIKFRQSGVKPLIKIDSRERANEWLFSIADNGIGIEREKFGHIFEIFARLHSHESYDGTGIGLAVCKKVVEAHGGTIWVESAEGSGSTFFFTIQKSPLCNP